jgi:hypothetical protein
LSLVKPKRIFDLALLKTYRDMPCACRPPHIGQVTGHHIKSKGSGGDDVPSNIIPLCMSHHSEIHTIGSKKMMEKHPQLSHYLNHDGKAKSG